MFPSEKEKTIKAEFREVPGQLRIGVDIDGVVADTFYLMRTAIWGKFRINMDNLMKKMVAQGKKVPYDFRNWPGFDKPRIREFINSLYKHPGFYQGAVAIPESIETLSLWRSQGHQIWFITSRHLEMGPVTLEWLGREDRLGEIDKDTVVLNQEFAWPNHGAFKPAEARRLNLHVIIEDNDETLLAMDGWELPHLMTKVLLTYPYNRVDDAGKKVVAFNNWNGIEHTVALIAQKHQRLCLSGRYMSHNVDNPSLVR